MSEYNMSHTGAELDSAINKVNSGYILPSGNKSITSNGTHDVKNYANAVVNISDSQHFAFGYKTMTANASFEITGLTDQQGNTFTPKGFAFTPLPNTGTTYTGGSATPSLIACVYDSVNAKQTRTRTETGNYKAFANIGSSSAFQVGSGYFRLATSTDTKYNCIGTIYFWIAWG